MPIRVACECGHQFVVKDQSAGRRVRCPGCEGPVKVPGERSNDASQPAAAMKEAARTLDRDAVHYLPAKKKGCGITVLAVVVLAATVAVQLS